MRPPAIFTQISFAPDVLSDLSGRLLPGLTGLVGPNGIGKSVFLKLLAGMLPATSGQVSWNVPFVYFDQLLAGQFCGEPARRIADVLGVGDLYDAFQRIEHGVPHDDDVERVAGAWDQPAHWHTLLDEAFLPTDPGRPVNTLSGGQQTRLNLCAAFLKTDHYLLLDEPGNHLDREGRRWLLQKLQQHPGGALVVSHDRQLLRAMDNILELSERGLSTFGGGFDLYHEQRELAAAALAQRVQDTEKELRKVRAEQQAGEQRAARRRQQGERQRRDGSQGKMLMDFKAEGAQGSQARLRARDERRGQQLSVELGAARAQQERSQRQQLGMVAAGTRRGIVLHLEDVILPFMVKTEPISLTVHSAERWHISGANGSGKSTLLKVISGELTPVSGKVALHGSCVYLDQHFSFLDPQLSALENLQLQDATVTAEQWRTWLGSLRLRADKALMPLAQLSGGERLKVALLAVTGRTSPPDLLLLDEPDNHLDLDSITMLENALHNYQGTLMLVSHDADFVESIGVTHLLAL